VWTKEKEWSQSSGKSNYKELVNINEDAIGNVKE
jgi:hypothetical protein